MTCYRIWGRCVRCGDLRDDEFRFLPDLPDPTLNSFVSLDLPVDARTFSDWEGEAFGWHVYRDSRYEVEPYVIQELSL